MSRFVPAALIAVALAGLSAGGPPPLPVAVSSFGAAVCDGYLYVYGGHAGKVHGYSTETAQGAFRRLKLAGGAKWEDLPAGPKMQGVSLVAHKGKLYRVGGMQPRNKPDEKGDSVSLTSVACYDPAAKEWHPLPDLPEGRSSHDAVVVGDTLYVVGGWNMTGRGQAPAWHKTAVALDLAKKGAKWRPIEQPFQRRALTAAAHGGKVYIIAGLTAGGELELAVDIYDPATGKWSKGADVPGPKAHGFTPAACAAGGKLYLSPADGKIYALSARGDAWEKVGELKQARTAHRLVPGGKGELLAVGGAARGKSSASVEVVEVSGGPKAVLDEQVAAWNAKDLDRFMAPYHDDIVFFSGGTVTKGKKAVAERYRKNYQSDGKEMGKLTFEDLEVEPLGEGVVMARARWQVATSKEKVGGLFTLVMKKGAGGWKITHDHTSRDDPPKKK